MAEYPEHEKLRKVQEQTQAIHDFIEWLKVKGIWLGEYDELSDACRNCEHDDPHKTELDGVFWLCGAPHCSCNHNYRGTEGRLWVIQQRHEDLLAEHFGIDLKVLEEEKLAMLYAIRQANEKEATG